MDRTTPSGANRAGPSGANRAGPSGANRAGPSGANRAGPSGANRAVRLWVALGVGLAVAVALTFDPAPTGVTWWDPFLTAAFVVSVTLGSMIVPQRNLLPALAIVGIGSQSPVLGVMGAIGACWLATAGGRPPSNDTDPTVPTLERAWLGVVAAVGLLQLKTVGPVGTPSLAAALAVIPLSTPLIRPPARRWTVLAAVGLVVVCGLGITAAARAGTSLRAASNGLDRAAVGRGDIDAIDAAGDHLRDARASVRHWSAEPARLVPILSQHIQVIETLATAGVAASDAGVELVELADEFSTTRTDSSADGPASLDLDTLAFARDPLAEAGAILEQTSDDLDGPGRQWLVPPAADEVDRADVTIDEYASRVQLASVLADELPSLLGREGSRAYLVLVTNPAEARRGGGIVGAFVDLTVDEGSLRVARVGRETELNWAATPPPLDPDEYPASFLAGEPHRFAQNWTDTTDPRITARAAMALYPQQGGRPVDGVITVDPWALAAVLELTGPIEFTAPDGSVIELDAATLPDFLLTEQYARFPEDADRSRALAAMVAALFRALQHADPSVDEVGDAFGSVVDEGRLTMTLADETRPNPLLDRLGLGGTPLEQTADQVSIVHTNAAGNKLDAHLDRTVEYRVDLDDAGRLDAEVRVTLHNTADPDTLPDAVAGRPERTGVDRGTNVSLLSVLTPHRVQSAGIETTSPEATGIATTSIEPLRVGLSDEPGFTGATVAASVDPGESITIVFTLSGTAELGGAGDSDGYSIRVDHQPLARDDDWTIVVNGRRVAAGVELTKDTIFRE